MSIADPLYLEAIETFREKHSRFDELGVRESDAVSLATVGKDGQPTVRTVLVRVFDERGFVFFTNSTSRKGTQMAENPLVALCFYLDRWAEQIRIEGRVEKISSDESDDYWSRRPILSRVGAWASDQSQPLESREKLLRLFDEFEAKFEGQDIPRPDWWYGYRVVPSRIEFWSAGDARLHERIVYQREGDGWAKGMLNP